MSQQFSTAAHTFKFHDLHVDKSQPLGRGSYGNVYKAKCDQLPCAAKVLHDHLLISQKSEVEKVIRQFKLECEFLSGIRHPHIVQFLGLKEIPDFKLPVLIMELLEESLTMMLEHSKQPLPYSLEVDLCHDISLAVAYLHSNGTIHRDLSSNNVLITAGKRAKVTDFGMSKIIDVTKSPVLLTACPGTLLYMPPEAKEEPPRYTEKLDCFSEGVLMIQICSRKTPRQGDRMKHIEQIRQSHPLLPIAKKCISDNQEDRPSAEELCQILAGLKDKPEYKSSTLPAKVDPQYAQELLKYNKELRKEVSQKDKKLKEQQSYIAELKQTKNHLWRQLDELQLQRGSGKRLSVSALKQRWETGIKLPSMMVRGDVAVDGDIAYFMNKDGTLYKFDSTVDPQVAWNQLITCPHEGSCLAVINGLLTAIGGLENKGLANSVTNRLISLKGSGEMKKWELHFPPMPTRRYLAAAATTSSHLIVIGGISRVGVMSALETIDTVEVMNTTAVPLAWSAVARLSRPFSRMVASVCSGRLYVMGGDERTPTTSVFSCMLTELIQSNREMPATTVWRKLTEVPNLYTTCVAYENELLAVGGMSDTKSMTPRSDVYKYNPSDGTWNLFTNALNPRYNCLVATFPAKKLMVVVGGHTNRTTDNTEFCHMTL